MVTISGATISNTGDATGLSVAMPSGLQDGDVVLVAHRAQPQTVTDYVGNPNFDLLTPFEPSQDRGRVMGLWSRVITSAGDEPSAYHFVSSTWTRNVAISIIVRGLDTSALFVGTNPEYGGTVRPGGGVTAGALDVPLSSCVQFFIGGNEVASGSIDPIVKPEGYTEITTAQTETAGSNTALYFGWREVPGGVAPSGDISWASNAGVGARSVLLRPTGAATLLATPAVTLGASTQPSGVGASDATQTVTFEGVPDAASYTARLASGSSPAEGDFVDVAHGVTSPFVFTGLAAGTYAFGIQARR